MTRAELHNLQGFHAATLLAAATHLRATLPRKKQLTDTTALVNNEGWMNGYLDAIDAMINAASQQAPTTTPKTFVPYSQPATENQNPKK